MLFQDLWFYREQKHKVSVIPAPTYGTAPHFKEMHSGIYPTLVQHQAFRNACKQLSLIVQGEMTDEQFDQLLKDTDPKDHQTLKKNRKDYKQDPALSSHIERAKTNDLSVEKSSGQINNQNNENAAAAVQGRDINSPRCYVNGEDHSMSSNGSTFDSYEYHTVHSETFKPDDDISDNEVSSDKGNNRNSSAFCNTEGDWDYDEADKFAVIDKLQNQQHDFPLETAPAPAPVPFLFPSVDDSLAQSMSNIHLNGATERPSLREPMIIRHGNHGNQLMIVFELAGNVNNTDCHRIEFMENGRRLVYYTLVPDHIVNATIMLGHSKSDESNTHQAMIQRELRRRDLLPKDGNFWHYVYSLQLPFSVDGIMRDMKMDITKKMVIRQSPSGQAVALVWLKKKPTTPPAKKAATFGKIVCPSGETFGFSANHGSNIQDNAASSSIHAGTQPNLEGSNHPEQSGKLSTDATDENANCTFTGIANQQKELERLKKMETELTDQLSNLKKKHKEELTAMTAKIDEQKERILKLTKDKLDAKSSAAEAKKTASEADQRAKDLERSLQTATQDLENAQKESSSNSSTLLESVRRLNQDNEQLLAEAKEHEAKMEVAERKLLELEKQVESFDTTKKDNQQSIRHLQTQVSKLEEQMSARETKQKKDVELLQDMLDKQQKHSMEEQSKYIKKATDASKLAAESEKIADDLKEQLQKAKQDLEAAQKTKTSSKKLLDSILSLTNKNHQLEKTAKELEAKSKQLQAEKKDAEDSYNRMKCEAEQHHQKQILALVEMESSATKRAKEAEKAASKAEKRALFLEKQLQTAKKEADNMEITDLRRKETNLSGRLLEEQMKHAQLIDDHEKEKMRASESERQLVQAEKKLSSLQAEINDLNAENLKVNTEKMNLELVKVGQLETEIGCLKAKLQCQKQEITQLQNELKASRECLQKVRAGDDQSVASFGTTRSAGNQRSKNLLRGEQAKVKTLVKEIERLQATSDELKSRIKVKQEECTKKDKEISELVRVVQQKNGIIIGLKEQVKSEMTTRRTLQAQLDMKESPPIGKVEFDSQNMEDLSEIEGADKFKEVLKVCPPALPTSPLWATALQASVQPQPIQDQAQDCAEEEKVAAQVFPSLLSSGANGNEKVGESDRLLINAPKPALAGKRKFSCDEQDDNDAFCDGNIVRKLVVRRGPIFGKKPEAPLLLTMESSTCKMNPEAADRKRIRIEGAPLAISAEEEAKKYLESSKTLNQETRDGNSQQTKKPAASTAQDDMNMLQDIEDID